MPEEGIHSGIAVGRCDPQLDYGRDLYGTPSARRVIRLPNPDITDIKQAVLDLGTAQSGPGVVVYVGFRVRPFGGWAAVIFVAPFPLLFLQRKGLCSHTLQDNRKKESMVLILLC
jgi:hypothetical protein